MCFFFQNNLNVHLISLETGDFKLFIGSLNNKFPFTVEWLPNILQSALCLRREDFKMAANVQSKEL